MPSNRRRTPRAICELEAKVLGPRGALRGTLRNLSLGGLFFFGRELLPIGQSADFEFTLDGQRIKATGEIRYHHWFEEGTAMGVRFVRLEPEAVAAIQRYIDASPQTEPLEEP